MDFRKLKKLFVPLNFNIVVFEISGKKCRRCRGLMEKKNVHLAVPLSGVKMIVFYACPACKRENGGKNDGTN